MKDIWRGSATADLPPFDVLYQDTAERSNDRTDFKSLLNTNPLRAVKARLMGSRQTEHTD